ncbi:MAG TPA: HAD-IA family hydrolase [Gaiellaceae bacterium]|nr:HAD-IA family hydrolase [Gaiellaceae bacterium]
MREEDRWATFDCYGTLIDWNRGIQVELERLFGHDEDEIAAKLEAYHAAEAELERDGSRSYREVMTEAMKRLGAPEGEEGGLADSLTSWQPFPEVRDALAEARERGWRLAILSNSDPDLITASKAALGVPFDETVVASEIHSFKPALTHWLEFRDRTLVDPRRHVHVAASNYHDIGPASKLRIPNIWINRLRERPVTSPTRELPDLTELPDTLDDLIPG